jgi:alkaline phosphatase D
MSKIKCSALSLIGSCIFCITSADAQHDTGRNAVRLLADGKLEQANAEVMKATTKRLNSPLEKAEQEFVLSMIACKNGDAKSALSHAKKAVAAGLPFERLLAGPKDVLQPLYSSQEFKTWRDTKNAPVLIHGPMLGVITDHTARIWVRTSVVAKVSVQLTSLSDGQIKKTSVKPVLTNKQQDHTAIVHIVGLKPSTRYSYQMLIDGKPTESKGSFTTQNAQRASGKYRVTFGGGAGYTEDKERMWNTIAGQNPDALLLLGDNVYIDHPESSITQRYCYYRRHARQEWRSLVASVPVYTIYDDHDFGTNDCVPGPAINQPAWKRDVWKTYTQNWNNPSYGGGDKQPGCWYDFHLGDVHFIMLDCRYYRDLEGGSMIGPVQKKWLFETLLKNKGESAFTLITSSVPWSHGTKRGSRDTWDGFPDEREEIFSFLEQQRLDGVLLISADRHRSDIWKTPRAKGYALYEFQSSRLTNVHVHPIMKSSKKSEMLYGYNTTCSFGQLDFDTTVTPAQVKLTVVDINGKSHHSLTLTGDKLTHKPL